MENEEQRLHDTLTNEEYTFLIWRGIQPEFETVCPTCSGSGVKTYENTATYMGGVGGDAMTLDVCDKCWGSGTLNRPGVNLKQFRTELRSLEEALLDLKCEMQNLGFDRHSNF